MIIIRKKELLENREKGNGKRMEGNREVERNGKGKEEKEKKKENKKVEIGIKKNRQRKQATERK